jgi:hypothetical protein
MLRPKWFPLLFLLLIFCNLLSRVFAEHPASDSWLSYLPPARVEVLGESDIHVTKRIGNLVSEPIVISSDGHQFRRPPLRCAANSGLDQ